MSGTNLFTDVPTKAAYTVANLRPVEISDPYVPVQGTVFSIDVTIQVLEGTINVSPLSFSALTVDGTNLSAGLALVEPILMSGELSQGQLTRGKVGFDVPSGMKIKEIMLEEAMGSHRGLWSVG
ncbi:DUF1942 domain-containing protein [Mycobacterium sp. GA-1285]|uniref:DUF1942 domain-containing protein n=1 Tax=Mycobacterium sp. GA-1285 TaxID=1772282 RepID=UPI00156034C8|nr:DUF1942 domain-containing protein [Mycobacterium sp. GA-1285]